MSQLHKFHTYINSFEPLDLTLIRSYQRYTYLRAVYEKENFIYFLYSEYPEFVIEKLDKSNTFYKELRESGTHSPIFCRNGFILCVNETKNGISKINMGDLSCEVITE